MPYTDEANNVSSPYRMKAIVASRKSVEHLKWPRHLSRVHNILINTYLIMCTIMFIQNVPKEEKI